MYTDKTSCPVCGSDDLAEAAGVIVSIKLGRFEANICAHCGILYDKDLSENYVRGE